MQVTEILQSPYYERNKQELKIGATQKEKINLDDEGLMISALGLQAEDPGSSNPAANTLKMTVEWYSCQKIPSHSVMSTKALS